MFNKCLVVLALSLFALSAQAVDVEIRTNSYTGLWEVDFDANFVSGPATLDLAPGNHNFRAGRNAIVPFTVDAAGLVTLGAAYDGISATGGSGTLSLLTIPVTVDPGAYAGLWGIDFVRDDAPGLDTVELVPSERLNGNGQTGAIYIVTVGIGTTWPVVALRGDGSMDIISGPHGGTADMMYDDAGTLRFRNTLVTVDDTTGSGTLWQIREVFPLPIFTYTSGDETVVLVPGGRYGFDGSFLSRLFDVAYPCAVDPAIHDVGSTVFAISCGVADGDQDGVPDSTDNCPLVPNPGQIDLDQDGAGDACDADDDNDGVDDADDNCPMDPNADQTDTDGDGAGDACDGDEDGDGVDNELDLCPFSPATLPVDADGCTGTQRIARLCRRADFVQHGQYVSCVAQAANAAAVDGLIAPNEKSQYVREAAKNK